MAPESSAAAYKPEQRGARQLWEEARTVSDDPAVQNQHWRRLMIANGHYRTAIWDEAVAHLYLAGHGRGERCAECPCWHCGTTEDDLDGDHSCPCPYSDADCPWHRNPVKAATDA